MATAVRTQIFLNGPKDWDEWLMLLKTTALKHKIWKYVDPSTPAADLPILVMPTRPTPASVRQLKRSELGGDNTPSSTQAETLSDKTTPPLVVRKSELDEEEKELLEEKLEDYTYAYKEFKVQEQAYLDLRVRIQESVRREFLLAYCQDEDPYKILVALQGRLAQTPEHKEHDLLVRWNNLKEHKKGQDIETWLQKWETTYDDCLKIDLPDVSKKRGIFAFVTAVHSIEPGFSDLIKGKLLGSYGNNDPRLAFRQTISDFREWRRISQYENKSRGSHSAFQATLTGRTKEEQSETTPTTPTEEKKGRVCACGDYHNFDKCLYLIPSKRPTGWKPKKEIQDKIKENLSRTEWASRKAVIERLQRKDQESSKRGRSQSRKRQGSPDNAMPEVAMAHVISCQAFSASGSPYDDDTPFPLIDSTILDSGATAHVNNDRARFFDFREADDSDVCVAGTHIVPIEGWGSVNLNITRTINAGQSNRKDVTIVVRLENVAYIPSFHVSIASLRLLIKKNIHWDTANLQLTYLGRNWANTPMRENQWVLEYKAPRQRQLRTIETSAFPAHSTKLPLKDKGAPAKTWHRMMGHLSRTATEKLPEMTTGCKLTDTEYDIVCEGCELTNSTQQVSRRPRVRGYTSYEVIHLDLIPMEPGVDGDRYILHALCDLTRQNMVYTIPRKHQDTLVRTIQDMVAFIYVQWRCLVRILYMDGEKGLGDAFDSWTKTKGIYVFRTPAYTKEPNGNIERSGRTLTARARALKGDSKLPAQMWPEIYKAAGYILNRTPTKSLDWRTPYEAVRSYLDKELPHKPNIAHFRAYGCKAFAHNKNQNKLDRLDPRAEIGYLVGYDASNIYRIWVPGRNQVIRVRDVKFDESKFWDSYEPPKDLIPMLTFPTLPEIIEPHIELYENDDLISDVAKAVTTNSPRQGVEDNSATGQGVADQDANLLEETEKDLDSYDMSHQLLTPDTTPTPEENNSLPVITGETTEQEEPREFREIGLDLNERFIIPGSRLRTKPRHNFYAQTVSQNFDKASTFFSAFAASTSYNKQRVHYTKLLAPPKHYKDMLTHPHRVGFQAALEKEYNDLVRKGTFDVVELPDTKKELVIPTMIVFTYKFDEEGYLLRYKARIVVRGDLQPHLSYEDNYAATLAAKMFRALMAIAAYFDLEMKQLDAVNAFCNAPLQKPVFVRSPDGFNSPGTILKLRKALYGLRIAPLLWFEHLAVSLKELGLVQVGDAPCVFSNSDLIVFFFVDDIAILYHKSKESSYQLFRTKLMTMYEMRDIGDLEWFLAVRIVRDRLQQRIWLLQDSYIDKITAKFHLTETPLPRTPMGLEELLPYEGVATPQQIHVYQQMVGSINYSAVITRPDIARTAQKLAEFLTNPSPTHYATAERCIRYLYKTKYLALSYGTKDTDSVVKSTTDLEPRDFEASSDASYGDCPQTRRSTQGYVFSLFGGPIDWQSAKQKTVSSSTTEAELLSLSYAAKQLLWWRRFFSRLDLKFDQGFIIDCDNLQTVRLMLQDTPKLITKLRHVDIHQHWLREQVQSGEIKVEWVKTSDMPADGFTKSLPRQSHENFVRQLRMLDVERLINL